MYGKKSIIGIAVLCTVTLLCAGCQAMATKPVTKKIDVQEIISKILQENNVALKNGTKQLLRIALFVIILAIALSPQAKQMKSSLTVTLKLESMSKPMKITINARTLLLIADGLVLVSILKHRNK